MMDWWWKRGELVAEVKLTGGGGEVDYIVMEVRWTRGGDEIEGL